MRRKVLHTEMSGLEKSRPEWRHVRGIESSKCRRRNVRICNEVEGRRSEEGKGLDAQESLF